MTFTGFPKTAPAFFHELAALYRSFRSGVFAGFFLGILGILRCGPGRCPVDSHTIPQAGGDKKAASSTFFPFPEPDQTIRSR